MTCDEARRLIHLWRPGETTDQEADQLGSHCVTCPSCAAEREQAREALAILKRMREQTPAPRDPEGLTSAILQRTSATATRPAPWSAVIDRIFGVPAFRYAAALLLVLTGVSFVGQQLLIMRDVSRMEESFARGGETRLGLAYVVHPEALARLRESREFQILGSLQIPTTAGEQLLIPQQTALAIQRMVSERSAIPLPAAASVQLDSLVRLVRPDVTPTLYLNKEEL